MWGLVYWYLSGLLFNRKLDLHCLILLINEGQQRGAGDQEPGSRHEALAWDLDKHGGLQLVVEKVSGDVSDMLFMEPLTGQVYQVLDSEVFSVNVGDGEGVGVVVDLDVAKHWVGVFVGESLGNGWAFKDPKVFFIFFLK